jgi:hypothetical protein
MRDLRTTIGVGVLVSIVVIFVSGFVSTSSHDFLLIAIGFALGMVAVYLHDRLKARRLGETARH